MKITRLRALGAMCATVLLVAACEDPLDTGAQRPNADVLLETWALTGGPPSFPSTMLVPLLTVGLPDAAGSFDIAFDIDSSGRLMVIPVSQVVTPITGTRTIGMIRSSENYTLITEAPRVGWVYDSTITVNPGGSFIVKVQTLFCQFDVRQDIYAKIFVDSVIPAERRIKLFARVNPNCGYRSFVNGIPPY